MIVTGLVSLKIAKLMPIKGDLISKIVITKFLLRLTSLMNLFATAIAVSVMISSAAANIVFTSPVAGSIWYTNTPNFLTIVSDNPDEISATVRFNSNRECFTLSVLTNSTVPVVLPRELRSNNYLNIYAISNLYGTATTIVNVINPLCAAAVNACVNPYTNSCIKPCASVRRGCGYYASEINEAHQETCHSELVHIDHESVEAKALQALQEKAADELAEDILAFETITIAAKAITAKSTVPEIQQA